MSRDTPATWVETVQRLRLQLKLINRRGTDDPCTQQLLARCEVALYGGAEDERLAAARQLQRDVAGEASGLAGRVRESLIAAIAAMEVVPLVRCDEDDPAASAAEEDPPEAPASRKRSWSDTVRWLRTELMVIECCDCGPVGDALWLRGQCDHALFVLGGDRQCASLRELRKDLARFVGEHPGLLTDALIAEFETVEFPLDAWWARYGR